MSLLLTAWLWHSAAACAQPVAFANATVIDVEQGRRLVGQTVLTESGRITAVGTAGKVAVPRNARLIAAGGKFLIPGLWDMHVHELPARNVAQMFLLNGITGVRDMYDKPEKLRTLPSLLRVVKLAGNVLNGVNEKNDQTVVRDAEQGREAVRRQIGAGADFIKVYNALPRDAYYAVAKECARARVPFVGHVPDAVTSLQASAAGQRSIEHLDAFLLDSASNAALLRMGKRYIPSWQMLKAYAEARAGQIIAAFARHGTWQCPTLVAHRGFALEQDPKLDPNDPVLLHLPRSWLPKRTGVTHSDNALNRAVVAKFMEITARMYRGGVPLLAGSDTGNPYVLPGFGLHDELELMVAAGLPAGAVLRIATLNPARFLGREHELGTVAKGKVADLVLLDADPLADIANTRRVHAVMASGRLYDRATLDRMLSDAIAAPWQ
ncbi:MAG: amidohydrolase family protein [Acidobacteria bacterium]|nr:amidohydrolase family protein [Acidobacteriota bacterium]